MSAMASGAELAYLPEDPPTLTSLQRDINALRYAFDHNQRRGLVINNEQASKVFKTQTLADLFEDQSQGLFSARSAILGHLQQGTQ
jgi:6-phosphofructokinase 1